MWRSTQRNYLSIFVRQKEGAWLPGTPALLDYYGCFQRSTKKWNDYVQKITVSWLSFHTVSRTSSSLWILASINQQRNLSQTSSTHGMLIELANNCQTELHLAMLKYPSNWVIWNLFMLGGLLRHTIISNTKMISLSKVSMLHGSVRLSHV